MSSSPHPYPCHGLLLTLSSLKVRIPFGPSYCPPSPLPFPPSPFSRGTHSHGLLSTISSTTSYSGRQFLLQGGWGEKKKMCVHCRLSRIHIFPSKGGLGAMAWHAGMCMCMCMACIVSIQLFFIFFLYFSARSRSLSLFIAGGCLASSVSLYTCTHVLCSCF